MNWSWLTTLQGMYANLDPSKMSLEECRAALSVAKININKLLSEIDYLRDAVIEASEGINPPRTDVERQLLSKLVELTKQ